MAFAWKMIGERKAYDFIDFQHHAPTNILASIAAYTVIGTRIAAKGVRTLGVRHQYNYHNH